MLGESQWSSCSVNSLKTAISKGDLSCLNDNNAKQVGESGGMEGQLL